MGRGKQTVELRVSVCGLWREYARYNAHRIDRPTIFTKLESKGSLLSDRIPVNKHHENEEKGEKRERESRRARHIYIYLS